MGCGCALLVVSGAGVENGKIITPAPLTIQHHRAPAPHQSATLSFSQTLPRKSCLRWLGTEAPNLGDQLLNVYVLKLFKNLSCCISPGPHTVILIAVEIAQNEEKQILEQRCKS